MASRESPEAAANKARRQKLLSFQDTDAGNAEAFELLHGDRFRYDHTKRKWFVWDGRYWAEDEDGEADRAALLTARERRSVAASIEDHDEAEQRLRWAMQSESVWKREAMLKSARSIQTLATTTEDFDRDPMLLTVRSGTLNLESGRLREARPEDLITRASSIDFYATAECPRWLMFLQEVFAGDHELIEFIQRAVGYSLTGDTREQCLFVLYGGGANGKSTFLETIRKLLDGHVVATPFSTFMIHGNQNIPRNDLAGLHGARLVLASEVGHRARFDESVVKRLTGQDTIACRYLYGEFFEYKPQYKIWLAINYKPMIQGTDNAIWRRVRLIPFNQQFEGERADRMLLAKLEMELSGILAWAVAGCLSWIKDGLGNARIVEAATHEYRKESDMFGRFLSERCTCGKEVRSTASKLYEAYSKWCVESGERPASNPVFAAPLVERGIAKKRRRDGVIYQGVGLLPIVDAPSLPSKVKTK